jgi:hypothetical protein
MLSRVTGKSPMPWSNSLGGDRIATLGCVKTYIYFFTGTSEKVIKADFGKFDTSNECQTVSNLCWSVGREDRCQTKLNEVRMSDVDRII